MIEYRNLRVALLGAGAVGAQVASLLLQNGDELAGRDGAGLEIVGIAVREVPAHFDALGTRMNEKELLALADAPEPRPNAGRGNFGNAVKSAGKQV